MRFREFAFAIAFIVNVAAAVDAQTAGVNDDVLIPSTMREGMVLADEKDGVQEPGFATGRVTDFYGRSIRGAAIILYCIDADQVRRVGTNTFGYYRFGDLEPGNYLISIRHRSYLFVMGSLSFVVEDHPVEINFQAQRFR